MLCSCSLSQVSIELSASLDYFRKTLKLSIFILHAFHYPASFAFYTSASTANMNFTPVDNNVTGAVKNLDRFLTALGRNLTVFVLVLPSTTSMPTWSTHSANIMCVFH